MSNDDPTSESPDDRRARLTEEMGILREARASLLADRAGLERRLARAQSDRDALSGDRWARFGEAVRRARRRPASLPGLPVRLARIALGRRVPTARAPRAARIARAESLAAAGRYEAALEELGGALEEEPRDLTALRRKREALLKLGEMSSALDCLRAARAVADSEALRRADRGIAGRLRELDTAWLPEIPGDPERLRPASPARVLHVHKHSLPYRTDGYTVRSRYTLLAQKASGLDPAVVTSLGWPRTDGVDEFGAVEEVDGFAHHRLDLGSGYPYRELPVDEFLSAYATRAAEVVRAVRPAVLNVCSGFRGYEPALVGLSLQRRFGIPAVYEVRGFLEHTWTADIERSERGELYELRRRQEDRCMREAAHVITIAEVMRAEIVERGIDPGRVTVIPNAVDPASFVPKDPDPALAAELGLAGRIVLGYVSNLGAREGIDLLIEATAVLVARGHPVACLVVGDGPERARLEALASSLGGAARVVGPVPHERVRDYYSVIDVFVIPRRDDRAARLVTPLKPYEAMAMGKTMLVSALPALLEIVAPGERGLSFDPGSAESLAAQAEILIGDAALRRRLAEQGRAWVLAERTWEGNGRRYADLYRDVLERRAVGAWA